MASKKVKHKTKAVHKKPAKMAMPKAPKTPPVQKIADEKAFELLKKYRISLVPQMVIKRESELPPALKKIGFPCVMKVSSSKIIHRTEVGGVMRNIKSEAEAMEAFSRLMKIKNNERVIIQKQLEELEIIVGGKHDPQFGYVVSVGLGGQFVEVLKDVTFRICPVSAADAHAMLKELKGYDVLKGFRNFKPVNMETLAEAIINASKLISNEKIKEMDLNPLFCNDKGCWAADVRLIKQ